MIDISLRGLRGTWPLWSCFRVPKYFSKAAHDPDTEIIAAVASESAQSPRQRLRLRETSATSAAASTTTASTTTASVVLDLLAHDRADKKSATVDENLRQIFNFI